MTNFVLIYLFAIKEKNMAKVKYTSNSMVFSHLDNKVSLPTFQRRLVWSRSAKKEFINTLHNGFPFGSILLYRYPEEKGGKYSLIDGLQRFTTIQDFKNNPEVYIDFEIFSSQIFGLLNMDNANSSTRENTIKEISKIIQECYSKEKESNTLLIRSIREKYSSTFNDPKKLVDLFEISHEINNFIKDYLDVDSINIPYVEFDGDESELAEVFENLNRGGQKLTKYQVFSAQWSSTQIILGNCEVSKRIMDSVIDRYNALNDQRKIEIHGFDEKELREMNRINLAELCYSIGKIIIETNDVFWGSEKFTEDLANELGYSWLGAILNVKNTSLSKIIDYKFDLSYDDNFTFLSSVIKYTIDIFATLRSTFSEILKYPTFAQEVKFEGNAATNFQILSYAIELWNSKVEIDLKNRTITNKANYRNSYSLILENLIYRYIYDTCTNYWSGTGDKKLDNISIDKGNRLLTKISKEDFSTVANQWNNERLANSSIVFDNTSKMFSVLLNNLIGYKTVENKYDYEHIIPKGRIKDLYKKYNISAGSLGNLMLLSENHNRGKKDKTLYEYLKEFQNLDSDLVDRIFYPSNSLLAEVMSEVDHEKDNLVKAKSMISNRSKEIINFIIDRLYSKKI